MRLAMMAAALVSLGASPAFAQTTVTLNQSKPKVVYATVRGGSYANTNLDNVLETRNSTNAEFLRRALVKFDTHNTIPYKAKITSAILTMTVKEGSEDSSRRIAAYQIKSSWDETQVTWRHRRTSQAWSSAGGDLGTRLDDAIVSNVRGAKVSWDVTPLVQQAVSGALGSSRYTRLALVDIDSGATSATWRSYYTPDNTNTALRPTLKVTYGGTTTTTTTTTTGDAPTTSTTTGTLLRVLEYNVHHNGWGTDGVYSPDRVATWVAKYNPHVVVLVEVERGTSWSKGSNGVAVYESLLEQKTGKKWYSWDAQNYGDWYSNGLRSVILSRLPFVSTFRHEYSVGRDRSVGGVMVNVNGRNINIFGTHFDPFDAGNRRVQAKELVNYMKNFAEDRIVMGDFNEQIGNLGSVTTLYYDGWAVAKSKGVAVSAADNPYGYTRRSRIDYVFYSRANRYLTLKKVQVVDARDSRGHMPSDHRPVLAEFMVR